MPKSDTFQRLLKASFMDMGAVDKLEFLQWCFRVLIQEMSDLSNDAALHENKQRAVV